MLRSLNCLYKKPQTRELKALIRGFQSSQTLSQTFYKCSSLVKPSVTEFQQIRQKYVGKKQKPIDEEIEEAEELMHQEIEKEAKLVTTTIHSLRADLVLKAGLNMARNKIELAFYENRIRLNEKRLTKKSARVRVGDEVDLIRGVSPNNSEHLLISKVVVLSANDKEENVSVTLKRFKTMVIENYDDPWKSVAE